MVFQSNASEAMRIDSSGNVGIGNSSPSTALDVVGFASFDRRIFVNGAHIDCQTIFSGDADNYQINGFYRMDQNVSNLPSAHIYAVIVFGNGGNVVTQIATRLATTLTYVRSFNTSWTSWASL